jgi:hypothetical protein
MHSPEVVVFELHIPIPTVKWKRLPTQRQWAFGRHRYECPEEESPLCGTPIHPWWRPVSWRLTLAGREIGWRAVATVWHYEPDGADSGDTCKGMGGTQFTAHNVRWAWKHRAHLQIQWLHYQRVHRWLFLRCDRCGLPFRGHYRTRIGSFDGNINMHEHCASSTHLNNQIDTFARYIIYGEDEWLARHWAKSLVNFRETQEEGRV